MRLELRERLFSDGSVVQNLGKHVEYSGIVNEIPRQRGVELWQKG
jgi:hypothetical protein